MIAPTFTSAEEILARLLGVDGAGSLLNADLLDDKHASEFELTGAAAAAIAAHLIAANPHNLGTAAFLNVGVAANNIVQLTAAAKLPAVDGSLLINLPVAGGGLLATGATVGATSQAQTFTNSLIATAGMRPASDTTSYKWLTKADGTTGIVFADTTNNRVGIGIATPLDKLHVDGAVTNGGGVTIDTPGGVKYRIGTLGTTVTSWGGQFLNAKYRQASDNWDLDDTSLPAVFFKLDARNLSAGNEVAFYRMPAGSNPRSDTLWSRMLGMKLDTGYIVIDAGAGNTPTALLDIAASSAARASLRCRQGVRPTTPNTGDIFNDAAHAFYQINATTNAIVNSIKLERGSSGTPAAGFGLGFVAQLQSSTTATQDAGRLTWEWITATHASRASKGQLTAYYTTTERAAMTWGADASAPLLSFYDITTPIARQVLATGAGRTVDDVITFLQNLGLAKQS